MNKNITFLLISSFVIVILIVFVFPLLFNNSLNIELTEQNNIKKEVIQSSKENDVSKYNSENSLNYVHLLNLQWI